MARNSSKKSIDAQPAVKTPKGKSVASKLAETPHGAKFRPKIVDALARRRGKALVVFAVVALLAWAGQAVWHQAAPLVAARDRYLLPGDAITMTAPPEWIVADVRGQIVHEAGLDRRLSIMTDNDVFVESIRHAFALHPWIESVGPIRKSFPPAVYVEVAYRRPVAVVELPAGGTRQLLPVDLHGIHLPSDEVPLIRREYLPRITGIVGKPPVGQRWEDPRVPGAVELAAMLGDVWEALHLMGISPSARPEVLGNQQFFVYELVARGGTRIMWGAAPQTRAPGEAEFAMKLQRLNRYVEQHGPLNTVESPESINVRGDIEVKPRMVKKQKESSAAETVVK